MAGDNTIPDIGQNVAGVKAQIESLTPAEKKEPPIDVTLRALVNSILDWINTIGRGSPKKADYLIGKLTQLKVDIQAAMSLGKIEQDYKKIELNNVERAHREIDNNLDNIIKQMKGAKEKLETLKRNKEKGEDYTQTKQHLASLMDQVKDLIESYQLSQFSQENVINSVAENAFQHLGTRVKTMQEVYKDEKFKEMAAKIEQVKSKSGMDQVAAIDRLEKDFDTYEQTQLSHAIRVRLDARLQERFGQFFSNKTLESFIKEIKTRYMGEIDKFVKFVSDEIMKMPTDQREGRIEGDITGWISGKFFQEAKDRLGVQVKEELGESRKKLQAAIENDPDRDRFPLQNLLNGFDNEAQGLSKVLEGAKGMVDLVNFQLGLGSFTIKSPDDQLDEFKKDIANFRGQVGPLLEIVQSKLPSLPEGVKEQLRKQFTQEIESQVKGLKQSDVGPRAAIEGYVKLRSSPKLTHFPSLPASVVEHLKKEQLQLQMDEETRLRDSYVKKLLDQGIPQEAAEKAGTKFLQDLEAARETVQGFETTSSLEELETAMKEHKSRKQLHSQQGLMAAKQNMMRALLEPLSVNVNLIQTTVVGKYVDKLKGKDSAQAQEFIQRFDTDIKKLVGDFKANFDRQVAEGKEEEALKRLDRLYQKLPKALSDHAEKLYNQIFSPK